MVDGGPERIMVGMSAPLLWRDGLVVCHLSGWGAAGSPRRRCQWEPQGRKPQGRKPQVESGQVASWSSSWKSLAERRGFPEGVKVDVSWPRAGLLCTCVGASGLISG